MAATSDRAPLLVEQSIKTYGTARETTPGDEEYEEDVERGSDGSLTPVNDRSRDGSIKEEKEPKKFREIWVLCLGLFSA